MEKKNLENGKGTSGSDGADEQKAGESQENGTESRTSQPATAASSGAADTSTPSRLGRCKWFNVAKGWGFITPNDGGQDVFVHQSVIQMTGFRSLGDDEEVEFEATTTEKGLEAVRVSGPQSSDCRGSHRRPVSKKRFKKIRCYNCGEFANHIAAKCTLGPQPKKCHNCKSVDHLIADCPQRKPEQGESSQNGNDSSTPVSASSGATPKINKTE